MEICTVGSVRGESVGLAMVDLNGHEAGNGGHSQGRPTAHRPLFYSERCVKKRVSESLPKVTRIINAAISAGSESQDFGAEYAVISHYFCGSSYGDFSKAWKREFERRESKSESFSAQFL